MRIEKIVIKALLMSLAMFFNDSFNLIAQSIENNMLTSDTVPNYTHDLNIAMLHLLDNYQSDEKYSTDESRIFTISKNNLEYLFSKLKNENAYVLSDKEFYSGDYLNHVNPGQQLWMIIADDADESHFRYLEDRQGYILRDEHDNPIIDPNCLFSIAEKYLQRDVYGNVPICFAVDFADLPFGQDGNLSVSKNQFVPFENSVVRDKMEFLDDNAYIMNHSMDHDNTLTKNEVKEANKAFRGYSVRPMSLVYPYGELNGLPSILYEDGGQIKMAFTVHNKINEDPELKRNTEEMFTFRRINVSDFYDRDLERKTGIKKPYYETIFDYAEHSNPVVY